MSARTRGFRPGQSAWRMSPSTWRPTSSAASQTPGSSSSERARSAREPPRRSRAGGRPTWLSRAAVPKKAAEVASGLGAGTVQFDERDSHLAHYDIVVCSTAAPDAVLSTAAIAAAMKRRPARPLLVIDLALPRDVEAAAADLENVFLYNLDDLAKIADANRTARQDEIARCKSLLAHRADGLWNHLQQYFAAATAPKDPGGRGADAAGHAAAP